MENTNDRNFSEQLLDLVEAYRHGDINSISTFESELSKTIEDFAIQDPTVISTWRYFDELAGILSLEGREKISAQEMHEIEAQLAQLETHLKSDIVR